MTWIVSKKTFDESAKMSREFERSVDEFIATECSSDAEREEAEARKRTLINGTLRMMEFDG